MKIAILNIYAGIVERGAEVFTGELAQRLARKHEVCIFQAGNSKNRSFEIKKINSIPFVTHQGLVYDLTVFLFTLKCMPNLWQNEFDWVIPVNGRWQVLLCRILRFFKKFKILISGHAGIGFEDKLNIFLGKPDKFVALTPTALKWAQKFMSQAFYIPNGVDLDKFNPKGILAGLKLKKPVILCNSALLPYKRIDLVIKAVANLPGASLLVIGEGPLKNNLEALGDKLLRDKFLLLPKVAHEDIPSYYRASSLFTLPSRESEAFGLVYLEALACGIPVVAPDDINRHEIVGEGGLFCRPENIQDYSATLDKALSIKWDDKPRQQAEKFSWDITAKRYEEIMENN